MKNNFCFFLQQTAFKILLENTEKTLKSYMHKRSTAVFLTPDFNFFIIISNNIKTLKTELYPLLSRTGIHLNIQYAQSTRRIKHLDHITFSLKHLIFSTTAEYRNKKGQLTKLYETISEQKSANLKVIQIFKYLKKIIFKHLQHKHVGTLSTLNYFLNFS